MTAYAAGILQSDVTFARSGFNLAVTINGTIDKLLVKNSYLGSQYRVEEFRFADGSVVTYGQAQQLIEAMASFGAARAVDERPMMHALPWHGRDLAANIQ